MCSKRTFCPAVRALHRLSLIVIGLGRCRALVKGKKDVRAKRVLNLDRTLGGKAVERAIMVRGEGDALVVYHCELAMLALYIFVIDGNRLIIWLLLPLCNLGYGASECRAKRKYLEATRVGHGRPASRRLIASRGGPPPLHKARENTFHVCLGPNWNKCRSFNTPMRSGEYACARGIRPRLDRKRNGLHGT